jgi:hypothetical protein
MSRSIKLTRTHWEDLKYKLEEDYPKSVMLIREKMKSVLGFTVREHHEWVDRDVDVKDVGYGTKMRKTTFCLDFYDEPKKTMFLLKYSEYLNKSGKTYY